VPLGVSPDGLVRYVVRASFVDAAGAPTTLLGGGDVEFTTSLGSAQWQTRMRFGVPAAIVSLDRDAVATVTVRADVGPHLAPARIRIDPDATHGRDAASRVSIAALGPHLVQIGWFPETAGGPTVRIVRASADGARPVATIVPPPARVFRDPDVRPGGTYRYLVDVAGRARVVRTVRLPDEARGLPLADAIGGKAMWLSYSPAATDRDTYLTLRPSALVARARASGIRAIEVRVAYGAFDETVGGAGTFVDALLDAAADRGIAIVAWTVPRSTAFEDLALAVAATQHRTARGRRFAALAVDLERGSDFLGTGASGYAALAEYPERLRAALGPQYPVIATVEDPYLERLSNDDVPYEAIAANADALQPMAYWRMLSKRAVTPAAVRAALRGSYAAIARAAKRRIAIDVGGQSSGDDRRGAPSGADLRAAVDESRKLGAIGISFFDWNGTSDAQWRALSTAPWPMRVAPGVAVRPRAR
jgi:hypothetical protein